MATKKISELPLVNRVSGSQVAGGSVLPIVIGGGIQGTTNQISVEDFSLFVNAYNATTSSNTFIGTQNVTGDVNISGRLTVREVVAQYETASILFSTGSTKLGDQLTDKHEFTGSTNITGSISVNGNSLLNGVSLNNSFDRLNQATQSLELFTSSQAARNLVLSTVTGSINQATASLQTFTASQADRNLVLSTVTGSINQATASLQTFTASQADRNLVLSIVTGSINQATASLQFYSASVEAQLARIQQATASLELASASFKYFYQSTASLQTFTASQADRNLVLSIVTGSINQATASIQFQTASLLTFTASQDNRNFTLSQVTGSFRGEIGGLEAYSASLKAAAIVSSSTQVQNYDIFGLNSNLYRATGSLIGITNGLMAFTASLDNTYATDAQLTQLYQATRSIELHSGSMVGVTNGLMSFSSSQLAVNLTISSVTGSLIGITNGLMAFTAALDSTYATDAQLYQLYQATRSIELTTGSLIGITNGLMAFTAALDSTYATDAQLYQLYAETASIKAEIAGIEALTASFKAAAIVSSSQQIQNYNVFALNSNLYNGTGSIKGEIAGIEAYTASLKAAAIVSSSQQVQNYFTFAKTGSANTFYGTQTISGSLNVGVGTSDNTAGDLLVDTANKTVYVGRQSSTSGDNTIFAVRNRLNTNNALYVDPGGTGVVQVTGSLEVTRGVKFGTATGNVEVVGNLVMSTAGNGIDFSATSNGSGTTSSELLNDYETGTWSPQVYYQNATDQTNSTNVTQVGTYTKIGNVVVASGVLQWTVTGSPANDNIGIKNFPFTSKSGGDNTWWGNLMIVNAGSYPTDGYILRYDQNTTLALFYDSRSDTSNYGDEIGATGTKTARFTITYLSA